MADKGKVKRALEVTAVARRTHLLRVLREIGVVGDRPATREGAIRFREALEELGTTFVKLGQLLSSRPDLLPDVYIDELSTLVDDVEPLPFAPLREAIAEDIGLEHFASIDEQPLASASIAQIHAALLKSGREVVVKVRRPGIVEQVALDLDCCARRRPSPRSTPIPRRAIHRRCRAPGSVRSCFLNSSVRRRQNESGRCVGATEGHRDEEAMVSVKENLCRARQEEG